ncbi:EamA family transporter RarD [Tenuibacillus multivorans]|uniref:Chloramphenicol-sensitive protein RarD n=1 Tax=Tenuibacillus multivorans TaxID=237069 RepID=A0A1G9WTS2_9BACI|nr:EamA family transporter RarD [Tenuibacillus multivorans]GEL78439.1 transporter [Tenuibacillus multivorans]SDM87546.1 chloramphenicol-sensitive protein RarD [Tenuibacillus multivorans]
MTEERIGTLYAMGAYILWGFLPLYWKLAEHISSWEILAHRVIWSFVFMIVLIIVIRRWRLFINEWRKIISDKKKFFGIAAAGIIISLNWVLFIWAVNNDHVLDASLGYYINPLISIFFGFIFLKERFSKLQWIAIAFAFAGVFYMTWNFGSVPWAALGLAISFAIYGLIKKVVDLNAIFGLAIETLIVIPIALVYIVYLDVIDVGSLSFSLDGLILIGTGVATAVPLLLFGQGAKRIPLSLVGFLQYFAPTIMLLLGVFLFNEAFTSVHAITFILIWIGLILYSYERIRSHRKVG